MYLKSKGIQRRGLKQTECCRVRLQQCSYASSVHVKSEQQNLCGSLDSQNLEIKEEIPGKERGDESKLKISVEWELVGGS